MTQVQLAEKLRVSPTWISSVELGKANLTIYSIVRLANALDANPKDLFEEPAVAEATPKKKGRPKKARPGS
jgi:transcriptional regulator with XRE-family HTH domain